MSSVLFKSVLDKLRSAVRKQRSRKCSTRFGTSDVVQESAIQLWQKAAKDNLRPSEIDTAWIKTVAFGHFCKLHRFHLAAKRSPKAESGEAFAATSREDCPSKQAVKKENAIRMLASMERLDGLSQQIVHAKIYEDKSISQISKELSISQYRARAIYHEALSQVRQDVKG